MFSQRILVALDTGKEVVYAPATGWNQIRLIWAFRHFRSLPQIVLTARQQQLMGSLYRQALTHPDHELGDAVVVGRIEDFSPSLSALPASVKSRKGRAKKSAVASPRGARQSAYARFAFHRRTVRIGAGALVALVAILAWHRLGAPLIASPVSAPNDVAIRSSNEASLPSEVVTVNIDPATAQPISSPVVQPSPKPIDLAKPVAVAEISAESLASVSPASSNREPVSPAAHARRPAATLPSVLETSADQPRVRISGRPRKLVYPVCPETRARGKVSLQAVVGNDGAVSRVRVLTGDRVLAAAAIEAIRQWHYEPFSGVTQGVERETNITVSFISNEVVAVSFPSDSAVSR